MKPYNQALRLLRKARWVIYCDLNAAGWDEVRKHPILKDNARVMTRIDKFLEKQKCLKKK